ncbi:hypothetical protein [Nocardioides convexus]|uniref:SCO6745 family protein n=1 Tax=Nocardioides convexus TaxID=2712224 RepID=UPI0024181AFC|nr:hypothetical protein [Nocardioides convexus]
MAHPRAAAAREVWTLAEPLHAITYFSPEPLGALREAGYRGFWMGYFAGRAAPLGAAAPDLVHALFHNFAYPQVARALPDAWSFAGPAAALDARLGGSVATLRRLLGDADVARAAEARHPRRHHRASRGPGAVRRQPRPPCPRRAPRPAVARRDPAARAPW